MTQDAPRAVPRREPDAAAVANELLALLVLAVLLLGLLAVARAGAA